MEMTMEFLTWDYLATFAGALAAVALITQLIKGIGVLQKIPTQLVSWVLAYGVILLAQLFTDALDARSAVLAVFNAAMVSLAANGGYDALKRLFEGKNDTSEG